MRDVVHRSMQEGVSKVKLAVGAASLFLFIVGLKRSYRGEDGSVPPVTDRPGR